MEKSDRFRTALHPKPPASGWAWRYAHQGLALGSCFATHLGERLRRWAYRLEINPFGVVYNPRSMAAQLQTLLEGDLYGAERLFFAQGRWASWLHHGDFSHAQPETALERINSSLVRARAALERLDVLVLTLGTAWYYRHRASGLVVSNCHKVAASEFVRERLRVSEIEAELGAVLERLFAQRPDLQVILTVSPIRHLKDGLEENQLSKSILRVAAAELAARRGVHYFPSYELLMDDLRDYRFYEPDMVHPSSVAVDYILERFESVFLHSAEAPFRREAEKLRKSLEHRFLDPDSEASAQFAARTRAQLQQLRTRLPEADFSDWG